MPLRFVLRPNEKVIINGAVIGVGSEPTTIYLFNKANFLRGREVMKEDQIDSIEKKLYFIIQFIYLFPESSAINLERFKDAFQEVQSARADGAALLSEVARMVEAENYYKALKLCGRLFRKTEAAAAPAGSGMP